MEAVTFHGPWTIHVVANPEANGWFNLTGTDADGRHFGRVNTTMRVDGDGWTLTMEEEHRDHWREVVAHRSARFDPDDGLQITLWADDAGPLDMRLVLRSEDTTVNPPPPTDTIPHDYTYPKGIVVR
ncbi:MAG: hypothetical protein U0Y82_11660 [Thermoleophilia bacterium]